ncbi:hypothetical protein ACFFIC_12530, partial [Roseomonas vinacea]
MPQIGKAPPLLTDEAVSAVVADATVRAQFDAEFYLESYPDVREARIDPFTHFMETGWKEGRRPSREFDTEFYLVSY